VIRRLPPRLALAKRDQIARALAEELRKQRDTSHADRELRRSGQIIDLPDDAPQDPPLSPDAA
jgi:hypothetical protein